MISSDDFPCYVSVYDQEKVKPLESGLKPDEMVYMQNMNQYLTWLADLDGELEEP